MKSIIFKGTVISIGLTIILLLAFATILVNTNISENSINAVITVISVISNIVGSFISTKKIKSKGIITGGIIGAIYIIGIYLISSFCGVGFSINIYAICMIIGVILAGMLGGIIGVNI